MSQPEPDPNHPLPGMHLWGWMAPVELAWLMAQAETMRSVVEIGCLHGRSSFALATACDGPVYCIDPWSDDGWQSWSSSMKHFDNVTPIRDFSPAAGIQVPDPVDMVFIDGAHDYDSVKADIEYWLPRTETLLCGHDYPPDSDMLPGAERGFPDVKTVVDEILGDKIFHGEGTAIWAYYTDGSSPLRF